MSAQVDVPFVNGAERAKVPFAANADQRAAIRHAEVVFYTVQHSKREQPFSVGARARFVA